MNPVGTACFQTRGYIGKETPDVSAHQAVEPCTTLADKLPSSLSWATNEDEGM